jgi:hypothetical protein
MTKCRVYFFCSNEPGNLQEDIIAIAEGLKELGIQYFSNCNYWLQSPDPNDYLFKHHPEVAPEDCDVVVVSYTWPQWVRMGTFDLRRRPLPEGLFQKNRKYVTVCMDNNDGYRTISWEPEYRQFDLILRSKFNSRVWHPENMRPWAYGWTNRIIEATEGALPFRARRRSLSVNFGASHPFQYGARVLSRTRLEPKIESLLPLDRITDNLLVEPLDAYEALMWRQTGGRFSRNYYERLKQTQAVACFCGDIIPSMPFRGADRYLLGGNRAKFRRMLYWSLDRLSTRASRAVGCDSFRFWEALAAGSAAINIDLGLYGVELPVMPENGTHYLGINFDRVDAFVGQLRDDPTLLERVADAGKRWAQLYYSPKAAAQRFLGMVYSDAVKTLRA